MKNFSGVVQNGSKRAAALGYPTINIPMGEVAFSGIFAARVEVDGWPLPAAVFADDSRGIIEAHILDFSENLYGKAVTIEILEKVRENATFPNDELLRNAIGDDIVKVRAYFARS